MAKLVQVICYPQPRIMYVAQLLLIYALYDVL
jgi:hypothetical protein